MSLAPNPTLEASGDHLILLRQPHSHQGAAQSVILAEGEMGSQASFFLRSRVPSDIIFNTGVEEYSSERAGLLTHAPLIAVVGHSIARGPPLARGRVGNSVRLIEVVSDGGQIDSDVISERSCVPRSGLSGWTSRWTS